MMRSPYLTRIVHHGCNLLGVLELLASQILLFATLQYLDPISDTLAKSVVLAGVLGLTRLDLWWRNGTADYPGTRWRFFSPFTGGSVLFIPVWSVLALMSIAFLSAILWQLLRK